MNTRLVRLVLQPFGKTVEVPGGTPLQEVLFAHGVEFPCGGKGRCRGCRVKVLAGDLPLTPAQRERLSAAELAAGWRMACQGLAADGLVLELAQWEASILTDHSQFEFTPRPGLGVAVDLGTTTLVAQLLDLQTASVLAVATALNSQAQFGADIMSRVQYALTPEGRDRLRQMIRGQLGGMIQDLLAGSGRAGSPVDTVVLAGNTVMHHLFCGLDPEPLSRYPFEPAALDRQVFTDSALGWSLGGQTSVQFLPCLGGFVGSDILAGILACGQAQSSDLTVLLDLGTNGEVVVGNRDRLFCASTAAGPAFEGARISMGMRAATGAISEVTVAGGAYQCKVLGQSEPRGLCGSGLVDAVAAGLDLGDILPSGRLAKKMEPIRLAPPVCVTQADIRELQLAKGAIAAGIRMLLDQWGAKSSEVARVYLAGAFGNYINRHSARRIGLFDFSPDQVEPSGNTALLGAKMALFPRPPENGDYHDLRRRVSHLSLSADPQFQDIYAEAMGFDS